MKNVFKKSILLLFGLILSAPLFGQIPDPAMVGYWENWQGNRFVKLKNIDSRYNVIQISFAEEQNGKDYDLGFEPAYSEEEFRNEMQALQAEGKKVLISIGGQNAVVMLDSAAERDIFVSSVNEMIDEWGFDGFDIDLELSSMLTKKYKYNKINQLRLSYNRRTKIEGKKLQIKDGWIILKRAILVM